jgi:hypothetical protein
MHLCERIFPQARASKDIRTMDMDSRTTAAHSPSTDEDGRGRY